MHVQEITVGLVKILQPSSRTGGPTIQLKIIIHGLEPEYFKWARPK